MRVNVILKVVTVKQSEISTTEIEKEKTKTKERILMLYLPINKKGKLFTGKKKQQFNQIQIILIPVNAELLSKLNEEPYGCKYT